MDKLIRIAQTLVDEFDLYGEVLQTDDSGEYGPECSIEQLRNALLELESEDK